MPEYRRAFVPGGTFFFTLVTARRRPILTTPAAREALRTALTDAARTRPFTIDAIVLLPDHLHCIWTLPPGDADFSTRWRVIKTMATRRYLAAGGSEARRGGSRLRHGERGVWQRRSWEHTIRDEAAFIGLCDYIHYNPVRHGCIRCPHLWPYSSFARFVRDGRYEQGWVEYDPPYRTAPNFKGAIGVTADSVEGVDITVPVYYFAETHYLADAVVTMAYKLKLFSLIGHIEYRRALQALGPDEENAIDESPLDRAIKHEIPLHPLPHDLHLTGTLGTGSCKSPKCCEHDGAFSASNQAAFLAPEAIHLPS